MSSTQSGHQECAAQPVAVCWLRGWRQWTGLWCGERTEAAPASASQPSPAQPSSPHLEAGWVHWHTTGQHQPCTPPLLCPAAQYSGAGHRSGRSCDGSQLRRSEPITPAGRGWAGLGWAALIAEAGSQRSVCGKYSITKFWARLG